MANRNFYLSDPGGSKKEYVADFPRLDGGLNLYEVDYRLNNNESPEMKNLHWKNGALGCRPGQSWLTEALGTGYSCYSQLFWGSAFLHIGTKIYSYTPETEATAEIYSGLPENRGTFFRYKDKLYYKNRGGYVEISYGTQGFSAADVAAYTPVTYINMEPTTHAGTAYQPENRLSASKTLWYNAAEGVSTYHLPEQNVDSVSNVMVDGLDMTEGEDYTVNLVAGTVTFTTAPAVSDPFFPNSVKLTYTKANEAMYNSVMDCCYAEVFGGGYQNVCVVLGGCLAQPNAYFWNGNHADMDAGYFPAEQYNLAGDTRNEITAFGKQQNMLVIFTNSSVGRATMDTTTAGSERLLIEMPYTTINSQIGCDLPWSVQLVENNLVFCNTKQGAYIVLDSSSAYENNIVSISQKVNGSAERPGLLEDVRAVDVREVCSFDDDSCYWIVANGNAYLWDYTLSDRKSPSWFFYTNINAVQFFRGEGETFHLNTAGRLSQMGEWFTDYGEAIDKVYRFAAQTFGGFNLKKDVRSILLQVRSDTDTVIDITYMTDYEIRKDLTPISSFSWHLAPRNLAYRFLGIARFSTVARRKPNCRHIRHFTMRLTNNIAANDMSVVSAQIFYSYHGRER